jgi:hypothetical protein
MRSRHGLQIRAGKRVIGIPSGMHRSVEKPSNHGMHSVRNATNTKKMNDLRYFFTFLLNPVKIFPQKGDAF